MLRVSETKIQEFKKNSRPST